MAFHPFLRMNSAGSKSSGDAKRKVKKKKNKKAVKTQEEFLHGKDGRELEGAGLLEVSRE